MEKIIKLVKPTFSLVTEELWGLLVYLRQILRFLTIYTLKFLYYPHASEHRGHDFDNTDDYLYMPEFHSAKKQIYHETVSLSALITIFFIGWVIAIRFIFDISILVLVSGAIAFFYFTFIVFKIWVVHKGARYPLIDFSRTQIAAIKEEDLPMYTIFIPLLHEAEVIGQIKDAMTAIDYPKNKLEYLITLEEHDKETREAIEDAHLPANFRVVTLPDVQPKTKPKALNVAINQARGEYAVIYDAEIIPDTDQLKKAYLAFKKYPEVGALQVRLDHYNADQNILTRLFNAEFAFYYDLFLPGLQRLGFPIPLSGHSTHFRTNVLKSIGAWDPYNVTEDCDIGIRLYRQGYETGMLNSTSFEEATSTIDAWIPQRTRWMKGFIQTSIVHLRHPMRFKRELGGWKSFIAFLYIVPGTIVLNLLNFGSWATQFIWFTTEAPFIQRLYPPVVLYLSMASFIAGSFVFMYMNLLAVYRRRKYHLVKYVIFTPIYWTLLAIATLRAVVQVVRSPHTWEKTQHGSHLKSGAHKSV